MYVSSVHLSILYLHIAHIYLYYTCRLQKFVDALVGCFMETAPDLMNREFERDGVKLHATVMNSKFASLHGPVEGGSTHGSMTESSRHKRPKESFDARGIFKVRVYTPCLA